VLLVGIDASCGHNHIHRSHQAFRYMLLVLYWSRSWEVLPCIPPHDDKGVASIDFCCLNQLNANCSPQRGEKSDAPFPIALNDLHMLARVMHLHHLRSSANLSQSILNFRKGHRNCHEHVLTTHKRVRRIHSRAEFVPTFVASHISVLETTHMAKHRFVQTTPSCSL
jgi:hypothetical protein